MEDRNQGQGNQSQGKSQIQGKDQQNQSPKKNQQNGESKR